MLDKEEVGQIRELLGVLREEIREEMKDVVRRDELEGMFIASERRIVDEMVGIVGDIVDDNITPQIQELRNDITSIKRGRWQLA
ncbi:MAG: hypothetical protein NUV56_00545 [Candidatus Uhrbacteria bacterium]|nr:hypothetical protein [Candidatus Uhrbacteria bacterium]